MSYLKIICGVLIWAVINGFVIKDAGSIVAPTVLGALMSLVGIIFLFPRLILKPWPKFSKKQRFFLAGLGLSAAINNSFLYTALATNDSDSNVTSIILIHYFAAILSVVWVSIIPVFKEKIDRATFLSVALGVIGLTIMIGNDWIKHERWFYFAFLSALFYSFEIVFSRQVKEVDPYFSSFTKLGYQFLLMPVVGLALGHSFAVPINQLGYIGFAGLLLFISFVLVFSGMTQIPVKHFSVLGYLDRLGVIAIDKFYWGKMLGSNVLVGGLIMLLAEVPILFSIKKEAN